MNRVIGYVRVSTEEQGRSGLGLAAQRSAIEVECERRGWTVELREEVRSGASVSGRPVLKDALAALRRGDALVVAKLDRLARSTLDFCQLARQAERRGWTIVVIDPALDLSTEMGRFFARQLASFAELERELIGKRIREALAAKRAGGWTPPVPAHKRPTADEDRVLELHERGLSQRAIAEHLTAEDGQTWHKETVARLLRRAA